jgi:hypothetical protein
MYDKAEYGGAECRSKLSISQCTGSLSLAGTRSSLIRRICKFSSALVRGVCVYGGGASRGGSGTMSSLEVDMSGTGNEILSPEYNVGAVS